MCASRAWAHVWMRGRQAAEGHPCAPRVDAVTSCCCPAGGALGWRGPSAREPTWDRICPDPRDSHTPTPPLSGLCHFLGMAPLNAPHPHPTPQPAASGFLLSSCGWAESHTWMLPCGLSQGDLRGPQLPPGPAPVVTCGTWGSWRIWGVGTRVVLDPPPRPDCSSHCRSGCTVQQLHRLPVGTWHMSLPSGLQ